MFDAIIKNLTSNWKTTAAGVLTVIVNALPYFGIDIDPTIKQAITIIVGGGGLIVAQDPKR